ncbi:MAG: prepilin peptidase [candidate division Zixibacteria bacterium]|nr:prepilin peptidase [candidate division Zixibacteria bacterium]
MMEYYFAIFVFFVGLCIGSFANVCIYRLPKKMSIVKPGSSCPACQTSIKPWHNIPLVSFIILGGKCKYCGTSISWRYPIIEFICGVMFLYAYYDLFYLNNNLFLFIVSLYLSSVFLIIFFIDLDHKIIPDSLSLSGIIIGFAISFLPGMPLDWKGSLIGILVSGGLFLAIAEIGDRVFKKESMGGGDIKLAAMMGGFIGWKGILLVLGIGSFLGAVIGGLSLMLAKDKEAARTIPFGPFLVTAAIIVFYWGDDILNAYLRFVGL